MPWKNEFCTVTLSECLRCLTAMRNADDEAHCVRSEYRGVCVLLRPFPILVIAKNHNAGLGTIGVHHLIGFYGEDAHGWNCMWSTLFLVSTILRQCDCFVRVH